MKYDLNFATSHHQFYIMDKNSPQDTGDENFWTEAASLSRLATGEGALGVGLECYGLVKGEIVLLDQKNENVQFSQFDHIVEGSIEIKSGILQVVDCPNWNIELEIKLISRAYRIRIYSINLKSVIDDSGNDYYKIEVWPDSLIERIVLKQFEE